MRLRTQHKEAKRLQRTAIDPGCRCRLDEQRRSAVTARPHPMSTASRTLPGVRRSEASFGHANQRTVRCGIGRCGKTPCASCGFPSCLSQPWARASQTASRRPSLERARCAAGLTHLAGAVCACAAATLIGDRSPSPTGPSCAATVGSTGGENGLAADEPHSNDLKAAGAIPG